MKTKLGLFLVLFAVSCFAQQPKLQTLQATIGPYPLTNYPGGSNGVITIYKSTSLGTVWSPFKPTAIFPITRTNTFFQVVAPNTFQFYATATLQPWGQSSPSSPPVTNVVSLTPPVAARLTLARQLNAKPKNKNKPHAKVPRPNRDAVGTHRTPN